MRVKIFHIYSGSEKEINEWLAQMPSSFKVKFITQSSHNDNDFAITVISIWYEEGGIR